jgi:hypothetical protein
MLEPSVQSVFRRVAQLAQDTSNTRRWSIAETSKHHDAGLGNLRFVRLNVSAHCDDNSQR